MHVQELYRITVKSLDSREWLLLNQIGSTYIFQWTVRNIPDEGADFASEVCRLDDIAELFHVLAQKVDIQTVGGKIIDESAPSSVHLTQRKQGLDIKDPGDNNPQDLGRKVRRHDDDDGKGRGRAVG